MYSSKYVYHVVQISSEKFKRICKKIKQSQKRAKSHGSENEVLASKTMITGENNKSRKKHLPGTKK